MSFPKHIYSEAMEYKRKVLQSGDAKRELLKKKLYSDIPEVKNIDDSLSNLGLKITRSLFSGDKAEVENLEKLCEELNGKRKKLVDNTKYSIPYECDECRDTGTFSGKYCKCVESKATELYFKELSGMAPFEKCSFENFDLSYYPDSNSEKIPPRLRMEKNLSYLKKYCSNFPTSENLLLIGGAGLGKTHLSIAIANEVLKKRMSVFYSSIEELLIKLEQERYNRLNSKFSYYDAVEECDLLIIDDLGTEFLNQFGKSAIYEIINTRLLKSKPTIINTNLSMEEIASRYSERISSRLIGNYTNLKFDGKDIRQIKSMKK